MSDREESWIHLHLKDLGRHTIKSWDLIRIEFGNTSYPFVSHRKIMWLSNRYIHMNTTNLCKSNLTFISWIVSLDFNDFKKDWPRVCTPKVSELHSERLWGIHLMIAHNHCAFAEMLSSVQTTTARQLREASEGPLGFLTWSLLP